MKLDRIYQIVYKLLHFGFKLENYGDFWVKISHFLAGIRPLKCYRSGMFSPKRTFNDLFQRK